MEEVMTDMTSFNVTYDRNSDVLYISARKAPAHRGIEDDQGIVWRYDRDGELIGVTIIDFYDRWYLHRPQLARALSRGFHVPETQAEVILNHVVENMRGL
jgi:uncharacterized protein YuzE